MWKHITFLLFLIVAPLISEEIKSEFKTSFAKNCDTAYSLTCLKLDIVSWVEKLNEDDNYSILPGLTIVRENDSSSTSTAEIVSNLAREYPSDPEARLDLFLMRKITGFLDTHAIKMKPWGKSEQEEGATARKKGGKGGGGGGGMGYLMAAGAMMKGTMMAMAMAALAAIAGKALMAALASLLLSAIAALKGHGGGGGKTTYEVVAKPVYTSSHTHSTAHEDYGGHGHSGYGRSFSEHSLPLGLQPEYKPAH